MTREEIYDFLVSVGYKDPAVVQFGEDLYVLGQWLPMSQLKGDVILKTREEGGQAVKVLGEGKSWVMAMQAAGHWQEYVTWKEKQVPVAEAVSSIRQKTVKE
jgi:hypothetical protein